MILWLSQDENSRQKLEQIMRPEEGVLLEYLQHKYQNRDPLGDLYQNGEVSFWLGRVVMRYELHVNHLGQSLVRIR